MTRYFFDLHDANGVSIDDEGFEFPDLIAVRREAILSLIGQSNDAAKEMLELPNAMSVEVRDEAGPVMRVTFKVDILRTN